MIRTQQPRIKELSNVFHEVFVKFVQYAYSKPALADFGHLSTFYGYVHTTPFSFLSVFVDENAVRSHCSVFK